MGMSSDNPVSDAAAGATKGALEWTSEKVALLVKKLKERKLAFIEDRKTIDIVKELYNSGEIQFYQKYIQDKELLLIVRMGLALRKIEDYKERLQNLRDKIFRKYKVNGLHIAEFVQIGALNRYVGILIDELSSLKDLGKEIEEVLKNIEKHALFVKGTDENRNVITRSITITSSHSPSIFIIAGTKSASKVVENCVEKLKEVLTDYGIERISGSEKEILFFKRKIK